MTQNKNDAQEALVTLVKECKNALHMVDRYRNAYPEEKTHVDVLGNKIRQALQSQTQVDVDGMRDGLNHWRKEAHKLEQKLAVAVEALGKIEEQDLYVEEALSDFGQAEQLKRYALYMREGARRALQKIQGDA